MSPPTRRSPATAGRAPHIDRRQADRPEQVTPSGYTPASIAERLDRQPSERLVALDALAATVAADAERMTADAIAAGWSPSLAASAVIEWWAGTVRAAAERGAARAVAEVGR
ncbi:hypothetical protein BH24ACT3_BH24ACT3_11490 [soil metagenome]